MKIIVEQVAWIKVERHFTHELEITQEEYNLILEGQDPNYETIEDWVQDQELTGDHYDYDEEWLEDRIESVELEEVAE
jgi:hypothetical protein